MKRYIKAGESQWLDSEARERLSDLESDEDFEDFWSDYLGPIENEVNQKLEIFPEPSTQGGVGSVFIYDESGQDRWDSFECDVDFQEWCDQEIEMALSSKTAAEYKKKYEAYVRKICGI